MGLPNGQMMGEGISEARQKADDMLACLHQSQYFLELILNQLAASPDTLALTDGSPGQAQTKDFPFPGAKRAIVKRQPVAPQAIPAGSGLLFAENVNRLGGIVVNKAAATGLTLVLADGNDSAPGTLWLAGNGGTWDFRLSGMVWCGNVFAVPDAGNVSVAAAEL